jgi:RES domain-containing protein
VHLDLPLDLLPDDYVLMEIEALDDLEARTVASHDLPNAWRSHEDLCRPIGDAWLRERSTAVLRVPSTIVQMAHNVLLNPRHPAAKQVAIAEATPFGWDERLFR